MVEGTVQEVLFHSNSLVMKCDSPFPQVGDFCVFLNIRNFCMVCSLTETKYLREEAHALFSRARTGGFAVLRNFPIGHSILIGYNQE